jgi:hypothetical protein
VQLLEEVSLANEELTRQMWINLLAEEIGAGGVHPEFINILKGTSGNLISPGEAFAGRIHEPLRGA